MRSSEPSPRTSTLLRRSILIAFGLLLGTNSYSQPYSFVTVAGDPHAGSSDGAATSARFRLPEGIAVERNGNIYIADTENCTVRKIGPDGVVSTLAGMALASGSADGVGDQARFDWPKGVTVDDFGNLYIADYYNHTIRKITPSGSVTTFAGQPRSPGSEDGGVGVARFSHPAGIAIDNAGCLLVADSENDAIRRITVQGSVSTVALPPKSWTQLPGFERTRL